MSRLDEMIAEICPDGVEYKKISTCVLPVKNIKWKSEIGTYQYIDLTSVDRDTHSISKTVSINSQNAPSRAQQIIHTNDILFGSTRPMLKRYCYISDEYDGQICSTGFCVLRPNPEVILPKWMYHIISSTEFYKHVERYQKGASYPAITDSEIKMYEIPVPPLQVQREIVRFLDNFIKLTAELVAELIAELRARYNQYQYYIDSLFNHASETCVSLGSLGTITRGKRFVHADATEKGVPCIHYGELYTYYGAYSDNVRSHIREELRSKMRYATKGDVIIVGAGENKEDIGIGVAWEGDSDVAVHDACYILRHKQISKYISYFLRTSDYHRQIKRYVSEGKICSFSADNLSKILIPLPSIEKQKTIAKQISHFDLLCNDIVNSIPAEIDARKKQYEYYRDKLLTFKEPI